MKLKLRGKKPKAHYYLSPHQPVKTGLMRLLCEAAEKGYARHLTKLLGLTQDAEFST
jgi:hypothetical protein